MAHTPATKGLDLLLMGINTGWQSIVGFGRPSVEDGAPLAGSEIQNSNVNADFENEENVEAVVVAVAKDVDQGNISTPNPISVLAEATNTVDAMAGKKRAPPAAKAAPKRTKNNDGASGKADPPRKKSSLNAKQREAATNIGYDSDGWEGPNTGTDPAEAEAVLEEALGNKKPMAVVPVIAIPQHVPISKEGLNKLTIAELKEELRIRKVGLPRKKKKTDLQEHLMQALQKKMPVYPEEMLDTDKKKGGDDMADFAVGAYWEELTPDIKVAEPVNASFPTAHAPTIPDDEAKNQPRPKEGFTKQFERPKFNGRERGGPRQDFLEKHGLDKDSSASEFVEAFFPMYENPEIDANGDAMLSIEYLTRNTNMRANLAFAGEATYEAWSGPFTVKEMRQYLGLYVMNGLSPSPSLEKKFDMNDKANFNPFIYDNLGSNASRRLKQFKCFFGCQDPMKPTPNRKDSPMFKILSVVKWIRRVGPISWECGVCLGLDEQTIGFQGRHADKLRITYKAEGDGFQCDALCDDGFTYSVFFRNEAPPRNYVTDGLCPLHARSMWLLDRLTTSYHRVWVDNLYMSSKFAKAAWKSRNKVLLNGVARGAGRGVPKCVVQEQVSKPTDIVSVRGYVKAAVLQGDPGCPQLVAMSVYDNKPVHFLSMACNDINWIEKTRKVWSKDSRSVTEISFLRLNQIDNYNGEMNAVDISDQLRNQYRMDHWLRQKKWWWSIWLWGFGTLITNAYRTYTRVMDDACVSKSNRLSHYEFRLSFSTNWVNRHEVTPRELKRQRKRNEKRAALTLERPTMTTTPGRGRSRSPSRYRSPIPPTATPTPSKAARVNSNSLHPETGGLRSRLHHVGVFHCPIASVSTKPSCALHRFLYGREIGSRGQCRDKVVLCSECNIHLCIPCFKSFHTVKDITPGVVSA
jgi:hypothetical protein